MAIRNLSNTYNTNITTETEDLKINMIKKFRTTKFAYNRI